jgi:hypothetical protein
VWVTVLVCCFASRAVALDGPELSSESGPVLVEIGGWQIFAQQVSAHGAHLRFDDVQASRGPDGRWTLVADRLQVGLRATGLAEVDWWSASGRVRLAGPDDLYVMAEHLAALEPTRRLCLMGEHEPAALTGVGWQLTAAQIDVDLRSARVKLDDLSAQSWKQRTDQVRDESARY